MDTLILILSGIWAVLSFIFGIPVVGFIFFLLLVWAIYWYAPSPIRRRFVPYLSSGTRIPRNMLARSIGDPDIFRQPGDAKPQIIYKEVRVARSFRSNVMLRIRWSLFGCLALLAFQYRELLQSLIGSG